LIYHNGTYYIYHPGNPDKNSLVNNIDNFLWRVIKFTPSGMINLKEGDVIRFGRIPFKVSRIFASSKTYVDEEEQMPGLI